MRGANAAVRDAGGDPEPADGPLARAAQARLPRDQSLRGCRGCRWVVGHRCVSKGGKVWGVCK